MDVYLRSLRETELPLAVDEDNLDRPFNAVGEWIAALGKKAQGYPEAPPKRKAKLEKFMTR